MFFDYIVRIRDVGSVAEKSPHLFRVDMDGLVIHPLALADRITSTPLGYYEESAYSYIRTDELPSEMEVIVSTPYEGSTTWETIERLILQSPHAGEIEAAFSIDPENFHLPHVIK